MRAALILGFCLLASAVLAQPPSRPLRALVDSWSLPGYHALPGSQGLQLPDGVAFASPSSVAITPDNHILVFDRGAVPFFEFSTDGKLIRSFGDKALFVRAHGLRVTPNGDIWVTDIGNHTVRKLDRDGKLLLTLGTEGKAGEWDEAREQRLFNEPNETAVDSKGNVYVVQGHLRGEPRVLKFSSTGKFIKQWGSRGSAAGQFLAAHSIEIDPADKLYVADRENQRIEQFDTEGKYLGEWTFNTLVCALFRHPDGTFYMTSGFDGEWAKLDAQGKVVGSLGSSGKATGQFGEAHYLALDRESNAYIADVVNRRVQIYRHETE